MEQLCLFSALYQHLGDSGVGGTAVPVTGEKGLGWRLLMGSKQVVNRVAL